jgi:hypothetical protein
MPKGKKELGVRAAQTGPSEQGRLDAVTTTTTTTATRQLGHRRVQSSSPINSALELSEVAAAVWSALKDGNCQPGKEESLALILENQALSSRLRELEARLREAESNAAAAEARGEQETDGGTTPASPGRRRRRGQFL